MENKKSKKCCSVNHYFELSAVGGMCLEHYQKDSIEEKEDKKKIYIVVFTSTDGHACSQPVVATSCEEAEKIATENEGLDSIEVDECYAISKDLLDQIKGGNKNGN